MLPLAASMPMDGKWNGYIWLAHSKCLQGVISFIFGLCASRAHLHFAACISFNGTAYIDDGDRGDGCVGFVLYPGVLCAMAGEKEEEKHHSCGTYQKCVFAFRIAISRRQIVCVDVDSINLFWWAAASIDCKEYRWVEAMEECFPGEKYFWSRNKIRNAF